MGAKRILILGSTGSIGTQGLDIIRENPDRFEVAGLTCRSRVDTLREQIREFHPAAVCVEREEDARELAKEFPWLDIYTGTAGLNEITAIDADMVLNALMGISGLDPTWHAVRRGRDIAFANKETLVAGGALITSLVRERGVRLLPVDSEHSAIFQCLEGNRNRAVRRILLTASGGPFRKYTLEELEHVTLAQALRHPKWTMGSKITIDSATMMNKGLEVIEARWLFDVPASKIDIHVHPESIVHSMVEFEDTSVIAQMGLPDMRIPISLAFGWPERLPYSGESLDFFTTGSVLHFEKPRRDVFRCIDLAYQALEEGGSAPAFLNGANEELVGLFLQDQIRFLDIQRTLEAVLEQHRSFEPASVEEILAVDREARAAAREYVTTHQ
ncbi:MAG: 1-deoxy-D-xylulose-5-phosphate reductoisomerase [Mogibacterium sp.]|nr:1-deoxy-D-xylulose-5-phosphate reductoisomerase [Mogibacterium sp.]